MSEGLECGPLFVKDVFCSIGSQHHCVLDFSFLPLLFPFPPTIWTGHPQAGKHNCQGPCRATPDWSWTQLIQPVLTAPRSIINEAATASPKQPIVNMGQGFFGYNPPDFILNAAKQALDKVDCNQYSPTKGRPRLKKAIADAYAPFWGRQLNPDTEVTITTGANEGWI